jgi:hypothetical protein
MTMEPSDGEPLGAESGSGSAPGESPATPPAAEPTGEPLADSTVGTGSVIGIGCTIVVLLITCLGVAIFVWRQVN